MKVVITVTAVYDLPDEVEISDVTDGEVSYGQHITYKGHQLQPVIEFLEYEGKVEDTIRWGEPKDEVIDKVYEKLDSEDYTIMALEKEEAE